MKRLSFYLHCAAVVLLAAGLLPYSGALAETPSAGAPAKLRLAITSNRDHYLYPRILIYEHDGVDQGKVVNVLASAEKRLDHQPTLSGDGQLLVYGSEAEAGVGLLRMWDLKTNSAIAQPQITSSKNALFSPSLSADGNLLAFTAWNQAGASGRWDVMLLDRSTGEVSEPPGLNTQTFDERRVAISGDGRYLAFTTNHSEGQGLTDIWLYDRQLATIDRLAEMNSPASDSYPSLSADGSLLAFVSDRDEGGMDIYLFDCRARKLVDLPNLNSPGQEQTPSLSGSGRYLAFVSERFGAGGEHDVFLYDRVTEKLLPTPELNTERDEYDPFLIELP